MFISPYFGGCKYTNNFLFINKNIEFQHFVLLITLRSEDQIALYLRHRQTYEKHEPRNLLHIIHNTFMLDHPSGIRRRCLRNPETACRNQVQKSIPLGSPELAHPSFGCGIRLTDRKELVQGQENNLSMRDPSCQL